MAGSYRHCINDRLNFIGDDFNNMIDNLGDAYEACEEMVWMIKYLSKGSRRLIKMAEDDFYEKNLHGIRSGK